MSSFIVDILVFTSLVCLTVSVAAILRLREPSMRIHALSLAVTLGAVVVLNAALAGGDWALIGRAALVGGCLLVTSPVSAHVLARLNRRSDQSS